MDRTTIRAVAAQKLIDLATQASSLSVEGAAGGVVHKCVFDTRAQEGEISLRGLGISVRYSILLGDNPQILVNEECRTPFDFGAWVAMLLSSGVEEFFVEYEM